MSAPTASLRSSRGIARYATVLCVLAAIAAVVAFANGSWLGVVWVLLGGLASNMAWYYGRRARFGVSRPKAGEAAAHTRHGAAPAE